MCSTEALTPVCRILSKLAVAALTQNVKMVKEDRDKLKETWDTNAQKQSPDAGGMLVSCAIHLCQKYKLTNEATHLYNVARCLVERRKTANNEAGGGRMRSGGVGGGGSTGCLVERRKTANNEAILQQVRKDAQTFLLQEQQRHHQRQKQQQLMTVSRVVRNNSILTEEQAIEVFKQRPERAAAAQCNKATLQQVRQDAQKFLLQEQQRHHQRTMTNPMPAIAIVAVPLLRSSAASSSDCHATTLKEEEEEEEEQEQEQQQEQFSASLWEQDIGNASRLITTTGKDAGGGRMRSGGVSGGGEAARRTLRCIDTEHDLNTRTVVMNGRNEGLVGGGMPGAGGAQQVYSASESSLGGGASSWTPASEEASGREEGDAHQDGSNGACSATDRRRRRSAETPVQRAADACKNKNCHYCEHAPKRSAFFACIHPSCLKTFCENCNSRDLDAPTYFGGQDDASRANWLCPICTRCVQPPLPLAVLILNRLTDKGELGREGVIGRLLSKTSTSLSLSLSLSLSFPLSLSCFISLLQPANFA